MLRVGLFTVTSLLPFYLLLTSTYAVKAPLVSDSGLAKGIYLGMTDIELIETVGAPEQVKSEGKCFSYLSLGLSVFFDAEKKINRIYLGPNFRGYITTPSNQIIELDKIGAGVIDSPSQSVLTYSPSISIQNTATVESEQATPKDKLPLEYRGNEKVYRLYGKGIVMKYKYVFDREGIALYYDHNKSLYAAVIYPADTRNAEEVQQISMLDLPEKAQYPKRLKPIYFDFDSYNIRPEDVPTLNEHVKEMQNNSKLLMIIEGHTDHMGSHEYNLELSRKRAHAAYSFLINSGISPERVGQAWYGKSRPAAANNTKEAMSLNRRAEFIIYLKE